MKKSENIENKQERTYWHRLNFIAKFFLDTGNKAAHWFFLAALVFIWQILVYNGWIKEFILPLPTEIFKTFIIILPQIREHIYITLKEAFIGFGISILFSGMLAFLMDSVKLIRRMIYPLLIISQTIPIIALAPLFVLWFGFGMLPKIIVVVLVCFFPIVVNLFDGLNSVDRDMINLLKSMGANSFQIFKLIKFPASMVNLFSGLRIAATYSIMGAVIAEWLGGSKGLGVYMIIVKHSYNYEKMFAVILAIVLLSMIIFKVISITENIFMPWNKFNSKNIRRK